MLLCLLSIGVSHLSDKLPSLLAPSISSHSIWKQSNSLLTPPPSLSRSSGATWFSYPCSCSSPCQAPAPSPRSRNTWHWTSPLHSVDCTWGVWHRSSGFDRSCCRAPAPCPVDRSRSHPHQVPLCSYGYSRHCPVNTGLQDGEKNIWGLEEEHCSFFACCWSIPGTKAAESMCFCFLPQSFSSEPSGQSSVPSQSFSAGRQMVESLAHTWWESLHTSASQLSSSELSSQSLSPSHTQALLMQRASNTKQGCINSNWPYNCDMPLHLRCPYLSPCSRTWRLGHTCVSRLHSSSRRSDPYSLCPRHSATVRGCTGHPSDIETHQCDSRRGDVWLQRDTIKLWEDVLFFPL